MKILVPIKRVIDPYVKVRVMSDQTGVESNNVKMSINPFDEIAIEAALKIKEASLADEIIVASIGPSQSQEQLRTALALGADRAILVEHEDNIEPLNIAKILQAVNQQENAKLIIMGKQSIDGDHNQTGQMLAQLLDWPQGTYASEINIDGSNVSVQREVDGGLETIRMDLPAVITTDLRLNVPRYASLPSIMKAKQKPLQTMTVADLGVEIKTHLKQIKVESPQQRQAGEMVTSVAELVKKLREEAKVI